MNSFRKIKEKSIQFKKDIPVIYYALKNKETPMLAKILAGITVGYALSPIDLIPDFIPILGYLDDILILPVLISFTLKCIPREILETCRLEMEENKREATKKKWVYSIPIIIIWLILLYLISKVIINIAK